MEHQLGQGDLVQYSRLGIKRQRDSVVPKDESTKGVFFGPAGKSASGHLYVWVDWYVSTPWERMARQRVRRDYVEPLGTPR